ncbi:MAG: hypothetical protein RIS64_3219 [Bacteroidota bacterium]
MKKTMNKVHLLASFLWLFCCFKIAGQCPPTVSMQVQGGGSALCQVAPVVLVATATPATGITYQWKKEGIPIPSGTNPFLFVYEEGNYTVVATRNNDPLCSTTAPTTPLLVTLVPPSTPIVSGTFDGQGNILVSGCGSALIHAATTRGGTLEWYNNAAHTGTPIFTGTPYFASMNAPIYLFEKTAVGCYSPGQRIVTTLSSPPTTFPKVPDSLLTGRSLDAFGASIDTLRLPPFGSSCHLNTARVQPVSGDTIIEWHTSRNGPSFDANGNLISLLAIGNEFTWNYSDASPQSSYTNQEFKKSKIFVYKKINGCYGPPQPIVMTVYRPLVVTSTMTPVTCKNGSNGSILLGAAGDLAPYHFAWNTGATVNALNNLIAGTYQYTVTGVQGCTQSGSKVVTEPTLVTVTPTKIDISCNNLGSINLAVSGGTPPYTYSWSNGATTQNLTNLNTGTYTVTVRDAALCVPATTPSVPILQPSLLSVVTNVITTTSCGQNNGSMSLTVSGGATPYTYSWSNGSTAATAINLAAGTYGVTVTDAQSCTKTLANLTVASTSTLSATITPTNATCGQTNGSIALTNVTGGLSTSYTYLWSTGATTQNIANVGAGTYSVTITSGVCTLVKTASVSAGSNIAATANSLPATCGLINGSVILSVTGGASPYRYAWSNGATTISLNNVATGTYIVTITDANNCSAIKTATVQGSSVLYLTPSATQPSCGLNNGSINLAVTGGLAPYNYIWSNGILTANLTNISSGSYTVFVQDAAGCMATATVTLTQSGGLIVNTTINNALCGQNNGSILTSVSGGTAPYTYLWSNGATTAHLTGLASGAYTLTVTATNSCAGTKTITLTGGENIAVTATPINATACTQNDGMVNLLVEGGIKPYIYSWSNGASTQNLTNLPAGIYLVTVTDALGCSKTANATVLQPTCGLANDNCIGSTAIPINRNYLYIYPGLTAHVVTRGATASTTNPTQKDVWYKFAAQAHAQVFNFTNLTPYACTGIGMEVYKGTCNNLVSIFYDNDICIGLDGEVFVGGNTASNYLNLNEEYYVRLWTKGDNSTGEFDMRLLRGSLNNICTYAEDLNSWHITVTTGGATADPTATSNSNTIGAGCNNNLAGAPNDDIWFKFIATSGTMRLSYNSFFWRKGYCNPEKKLTFSLYNGSCGGTVVLSAENVSFGDGEEGNINITGLTPNNQYFIKIWTNGTCNNYGIFNLKVNPVTSNSGSSGNYTIHANQQLPIIIQAIYPVPTDEIVTIQLNAKVSEPIQFQFYDARGSLVQRQEQNVQMGMNELHFDVTNLPSGVYSVMIPGVPLRNSPMQFVKL